jgi:hypothetical protein
LTRTDIESCGLITDTLRLPEDNARRWLDLQILSDVSREARALLLAAA